MNSLRPTKRALAVKEIVFRVEGRGAYSVLKYESGVHRPACSDNGSLRPYTYVHCNCCRVAEPDEVDVEIRPEDLEDRYYEPRTAASMLI